MSCQMPTTTWPRDGVPIAVQNLVNRFYHLADQKDENVGQIVADELFTEDAILAAPTATYTGKNEIAKFRAGVWDSFAYRHHHLFKVYTNDTKGLDLIVVGGLIAVLKNGQETFHQFVARVSITSRDEGYWPRIKDYRVLMVVAKEPKSAVSEWAADGPACNGAGN